MASKCRERGMHFTYHNHDQEFAVCPETGQRYYDMLSQATDPTLARFHLDVAWRVFGGVDPVFYAGKCHDRLLVFHMKDLQRLEKGCLEAKGVRSEARFAEVGDGIVPIDALVRIAPETTAEWMVVEQDRPGDLEPWSSVERSYENLSEMWRRWHSKPSGS